MKTNLNEYLVYPEESYKIMGILFEVHNKLGTKYQEKHYQRAAETKFIEYHIPYKKEVRVTINFGNRELGTFFLDFLVFNKIILEFKKVNFISQDDIKQALRYLDTMKSKLCIIANFKHKRLEYIRVINPRYDSYKFVSEFA